MTQPHLAPQASIALLLTIKLKSGAVLRFQNYSAAGNLVWTGDGQTYQYLPIKYSGSPKSLELDNTTATVYIPNNALIRSYLYDNDGLRQAIVICERIFPDNPNATPIIDRLQVAQSKFNYPEVEISLKSPVAAIGSTIPSKYFTSKKFPSLPTSTQTNI